MKKGLFHPAYFAPLDQWLAIAGQDALVYERHDFFRKQTYRTRMHIYGANGMLKLSIPVIHTGAERRYTKEVRIENAFPWQRNHWRSLVNAYRSSPYFEYFEDELVVFYEKKYDFLFDFLMETQYWLMRQYDINPTVSFTNSYETAPGDSTDYRPLIHAKEYRDTGIRYHQVFEEKHGFLPNLSVLDKLFNTGPGK